MGIGQRGAGARGLLRACAVLTLACTLLAPGWASAMTAAKITLNQQTGGKPTRFTFVGVTDADGPLETADLVFPEGFDLSKARVVVDTIEGIQVTSAPASPTVVGTTLKLDFATPVAPSKQLRVLIYDVDTPFQGKTYELGVRYTVGGAVRQVPGLEFAYTTPPWWEQINRWLDQQPAVTGWNSVKFFGIFLRPQYALEGIQLAFAGWLLSLTLVGVAFPLAITLGLAMAFVKMSKVAIARWIASAYVNVIRGTPLFLQIYIAFVGLRIAGLRASDFVTAVIVLMLNSAAYLTEIFRAGIQSINKGQFEAALSLGMTYAQAMRYVIIPQTVKRVLPTMTSEFILLFKDTALLFPVGIFELMMYSNQLVARTGNLTPYMVAAGYYLVITIPLINWVTRLEGRLAVSEHGQTPSETKKRRGGLFSRPPAILPSDADGR
jgi:polar amino acid transport system substrate-binding protein